MIPRLLGALLLLLSSIVPAAAQQTCTFTLSPSFVNAPAATDTVGSFTVTASSGTCVRNAASDSPWLTISFGTTGTGNGTVGYRVDANRTASARTGRITIGSAQFTVNQAGGTCTFSMSPLSARVANTAGSGSITVNSSCQWNALSNAGWLRVTPTAGSGNGVMLQYNYDANLTTQERAATITVGTAVFTLTQTGIACNLSLLPTSVDAPGDGGIGSFNITTQGCTWRATPSATWITLTSADSGTGNATVNYRVAANTASTSRLGSITVNDQVFTIRQAATLMPVISGITNAASYATGSAAPGEVVAIFGSQLGPFEIAGAELTADGRYLKTEVAGTRVLFDGVAAPLVFVRADVLSAIVPYGASGKMSVPVVVEYQGRRSAAMALRISDTAPGIFTADQSGKGQGAIFNEDLTRNGASNPARRGGQVVLFVTGEGLLTPPQEDGQIVGLDQPQASASVTVSIGGASAPVVYKGPIFGVTAGVLQINAVVPPAAPTGAAVPLNVVIGGVSAQTGVTVAISQ